MTRSLKKGPFVDHHLVAKVDKAQAWLDDSVAAQAKLEAHDDPAFKVSDLGLKLKSSGKISGDPSWAPGVRDRIAMLKAAS